MSDEELKSVAVLKCLKCGHQRVDFLSVPLTVQEIQQEYSRKPFEVLFCENCEKLALHQHVFWE